MKMIDMNASIIKVGLNYMNKVKLQLKNFNVNWHNNNAL